MKRLILVPILCLLAGTRFAPQALAHGASSEIREVEEIIAIYRMAVDLEPLVFEQKGPAVATIRLGDETLVLNSHFWNLVAEWIRVYHKEIERECPGCRLPTVEESLKFAKDEVAKSFAREKIISPFLHGLEHIALEATQIGAELGRVAMVAKIAAEVAETVASKMIGGGGVHVLCAAVDALILFGTRHIQTFYRVPVWAGRMGESQLRAFVTQAYLSHVIRRAQKKVTFETGPVEIDVESLKSVDLEGPTRFMGWFSEGQRDHWVRQLVEQSNEKIRELKALQLARAIAPEDSEVRKLEREIKRLEKDIEKIKRMGRGTVSTSKAKRFVLFKSDRQKRGPYIRGASSIEKASGKGLVWILSVQENVLNRSLLAHPAGHRSPLEDMRRLLEAPNFVGERDFRRALANEYVLERSAAPSSQHVEELARLLGDVEKIFDSQFSKRERYLQAVFIESTLAGFLRALTHIMADHAPLPLEPGYKGLKTKMALRWRLGLLTAFIYEYSDFLKVAAGTSHQEKLVRYRYEAMDVFLQIFASLQVLKDLPDASSSDRLHELFRKLDERTGQLQSLRPWVEKKTWWRITPFMSSAPRCESLALAEGA